MGGLAFGVVLLALGGTLGCEDDHKHGSDECGGHGHSHDGISCHCDAGYEMAADNLLLCVPKGTGGDSEGEVDTPDTPETPDVSEMADFDHEADLTDGEATTRPCVSGDHRRHGGCHCEAGFKPDPTEAFCVPQ